LLSVQAQDLPVELIVADDCSTDSTRRIAASFGARILTGPLPLLDARVQAARAASTDIVVLLDSDQILRAGALRRSVAMLDDFDALVLAEASCPPSTWISALFASDKRLLHHLSSHHLSPQSGSLIPRVFRKAVLLRALDSIPDRVRRVAVAQDHAIIWSEVGKLTTSVGIVPDAVLHEEMTTLVEVWRKYFRWGAGLPSLFETAPEYRLLTHRSMRARLHRGDAATSDYLRSMALLAIKTVPYGLGFAYGKAVQRRGE
jgi:cellulose synthase/poly-beta-1,6-N-acetylglucosamine synthase-like glycosyltransferase